MNRRRFAFIAVLLVAVNAFFWVASTGFAGSYNTIIQSLFGTHMVRADVIWMDGTKVTDTRVDRGVITAVVTTAPASITLRERDGTSWTIPVSSTVTVRIGSLAGTLTQLKPRMRVIVTRPATGSADTIQVEGFGP